MRNRKPVTKSSGVVFFLFIIGSCALALSAQLPAPTASGQRPTKGQVVRPLPPADVDGQVTRPDSVMLSFPSGQTHSVTRIDPSDISLKSESALLRSGADLSSLLTSRGIAPDTNSLSIVYDLNPDIDMLGTVRPGTVLVLPKVEGGRDFQAAKDAGLLVRLTKDPTWSQAIAAHTLQMPGLYQGVMTLQTSRFDRVEDRNAMARSIEESKASLAVILDDRFPTSQKVLRQSALEVEALNMIVERTLRSNGKVPNADLEKARRIAEGLKQRSQDIADGGSGRGRIEVHTLKQSDGSPVERLRVFYAPTLDPTSVGIYRDPSSPTTEALPVGGDFLLWAGVGNDSTSVSDKIPVSVKGKNNDPVKLLVK